jgi:glutathione peroxidase
MDRLYDFEVTDIRGNPVPMRHYEGKALLIVNVASRCGLTPQYEGLEALQRTYQARGFSVLGFPCNQFGRQEPGTGAEIEEFCQLKFGVTFPLFAKIDVNGDSAHPLYRYIRTVKRGLLGTTRIKWNFTKFLVDRQGAVRARYAPSARPAKIENDIATLLDGAR